LNKEETKILNNDCSCKQTSVKDIEAIVDEVVALTGRDTEKLF